MNKDVSSALLEGNAVITRREHPQLASTLHRLAQRGELVAVLPGVFVVAGAARDWRTLALAACRWDQQAVLVGETAAALTFWPELTPTTVCVANRRCRFHRHGFEFTRNGPPPELVTHAGDLRLTSPALTALDLLEKHGGDAIDRALRSRMATVASMYRALAMTEHRRGNPLKRQLLLDSRDEPWSAAERLAHRVFRAAGLSGWKTNVPVRCGSRRYFLDIAFPGVRLAIEIDGREFHGPDTFEADRRRDTDLQLSGWMVLHFTWRMLADEPDWVVAVVKRALRRAA